MMPLPATLYLGYALLGAALFCFCAGIRGFPLRQSELPLAAHVRRGSNHGAALAQAVVTLVLATLLLLAGTIALLTAAPQLL